jgi:hypothetical protein
MGEDDEAMTMSTTSSSFTDAAIATVTGEQHQRPRESRDSNRAVKEREAIANAQRKCEKALDEIREEAVAAANVAAERKRFEQSDVAKEKKRREERFRQPRKSARIIYWFEKSSDERRRCHECLRWWKGREEKYSFFFSENEFERIEPRKSTRSRSSFCEERG